MKDKLNFSEKFSFSEIDLIIFECCFIDEVADLVFLLFDLSYCELNFSEEKDYISFFREFFIFQN